MSSPHKDGMLQLIEDLEKAEAEARRWKRAALKADKACRMFLTEWEQTFITDYRNTPLHDVAVACRTAVRGIRKLNGGKL